MIIISVFLNVCKYNEKKQQFLISAKIASNVYREYLCDMSRLVINQTAIFPLQCTSYMYLEYIRISQTLYQKIKIFDFSFLYIIFKERFFDAWQNTSKI